MFSVSTQNQIIVSVSRTLLNIRKIGRRENKIRKKSPDGFHLSLSASAPTGFVLFCFVGLHFRLFARKQQMLIAFKLRLGPDDPVVTLDVESPGFERWLQLLQK